MFDVFKHAFDTATKATLLGLAAALVLILLAGCGSTGLQRPEGPGQMALAVEVTATKVNRLVERLAKAEQSSRAACAAGQAAQCRPHGYYMTRERGESLLDYTSGVKTASRIAVDSLAQGATCAQGRELEILGLRGCVDGMTILRVALAGLNEINNRLNAEVPQ